MEFRYYFTSGMRYVLTDSIPSSNMQIYILSFTVLSTFCVEVLSKCSFLIATFLNPHHLVRLTKSFVVNSGAESFDFRAYRRRHPNLNKGGTGANRIHKQNVGSRQLVGSMT